MGGRKIDDHGSWMGAAPKGEVFPHGPYKLKGESSAEGVGELMRYEDSTEAIKSQQEMGKKKVQGHGRKDGYRN